MALFKIYRGAETNLPTTLTSGYCYFCTDTTNFYIDYTDTYGALTRAKISSKYADKLRYTEDGNFIELDPTDIVTKSNYETAIGVVTSDKNGLMSSSDKIKLDGISSGATAVSIDTTLTQRGQAADAKAVGDELAKKLDNPQTAAVGDVLTVEEVDENGKPTKWKTAPAAAEQVQSDWYEQDPTKPSYVKNGFAKLEFTEKKAPSRMATTNSYQCSVNTPSGESRYVCYQLSVLIAPDTYDTIYVDIIPDDEPATLNNIKVAIEEFGKRYAITNVSVSSGHDPYVYYFTPKDNPVLVYICGVIVNSEIDVRFLPPPDFNTDDAGIFKASPVTNSAELRNLKAVKYYNSYTNPDAATPEKFPSLYAEKEIKTFDTFDFNTTVLGQHSSEKFSLCYTSNIGNACTELGITKDDLPIMSYLMDYLVDNRPWGTYYIETATNKRFIATYKYGTTTWSNIKKLSGGSAGGSSAFHINITSTTDDSGNTTYSADKTADEIIAAYESGAVIIGVYGKFYMQGISHSAKPHELTLIFGAQAVDDIRGIFYQYNCFIYINKDNKEMDVSYEQNEIILDEGIDFIVDNGTVQASGSFNEVVDTIFSALENSKSINITLGKGSAIYNLSRLEGSSNGGILIKFDDVANSKTYIVFADIQNETFTYSEEDLPSGGSTGEIDPKKIPDMYYTGVGSVDIAGKIITSVTLYRNEEGTLEKACPFELGQVWKVIMDPYTSGELEVKQSSDGTLYIGDLNKGNPPFYITTTSSSANPNWLSNLGVSSNENGVASLVGVSGTMSGGEIIHKIPEQYIPDVVALKNELPDMAIKVIELDNVIVYPTINIDDVDKPVLAIFKCDKNTQFKFDRVRIKTPLRERDTEIAYQSGANSENPYACMMILIKKIASSEDIFEAICLNARTKSNTILDIDNSGFKNKDYASLPDGTYNFLSTYTSNSSFGPYRIKGFTTVTNHCFKCYDTGDSITFNPNGNIANYGDAYSITETDPTVPKWAKAATKPTYTAEEVGALPNTTVIPTVPTTLPNPHKLTFTGAVTGEYDGSSAVAIEIPKGGKASANFLIQPNGTVLSAPTYAQLTSGTYASFYALYGGTLYALSQQTQTSGTFTFKFNDVPNGKMYVVTVDSSDNTTFAEEDLPTTTVTLKTWTSADIS